jgi:uncharacterized SAM-binding protein YcdF (DUF218 family)
MLLYLSKLAPLFVYPLGFALLLLGAALFLRRRYAWRTTLEVLALVVLLVFSNQWVAHGLARSLEYRYWPPEVWPERATVVVLGGGTRVHEYPRLLTEVNEAGDRVIFGAWLYRQGVAARLVVTGGAIEWLGSTHAEAEGMRELLMFMGVPDDAIILEDASQNTYDNAVFARTVLEGLTLDVPDPVEVVLVTSAMHMPRSVAIFERQGFTVLPAPVDYVSTLGDPARTSRPGLGERFLHLLPNVEYLEISSRVLREHLGMLVYGVLGRL